MSDVQRYLSWGRYAWLDPLSHYAIDRVHAESTALVQACSAGLSKPIQKECRNCGAPPEPHQCSYCGTKP